MDEVLACSYASSLHFKTDYIVVKNVQQIALLSLELIGQISDGQWENSYPHGHYKKICNAKIILGNPDIFGLTFYADRKYNFLDQDYYSQRKNFMLNMVEMAMHVGIEKIRMCSNISSSYFWNDGFDINQYNKDKEKFLSGEITSEYIARKMQHVNEIGLDFLCNMNKNRKYTIKHLRKDLTELKEIINKRGGKVSPMEIQELLENKNQRFVCSF